MYTPQSHRTPNLLKQLTRQMLAYARGVESVAIIEASASPKITRRLQTISAVGKLAASGFGKPIDLASTGRIAATSQPQRTPSTLTRPRLASATSSTTRIVVLR
jgi:hypothetical protein